MNTIISLTTLPGRQAALLKTLKSLESQNLKDFEIHLYIPKKVKRNKHPTDITINFKDFKKLKTKEVEDVGPVTKIWYTLKDNLNNDINIITADDDVIYPPNWGKTLIETSKSYKNHAIGYRGRKFFSKDIDYRKTILKHCKNINQITEVDIITGTWGALYKPKFFDESFFNLDLSSQAFYTDDIWITGHLAKNKIKRIICPLDQTIIPSGVENVNSLWEINKFSTNNNYTLSLFKEYLQT